ncbi:MAG: YfhO family protein, partial [Myxococcota bacterium]|nr:YfhO family protein [Myxococcota bacterium]
LALLGAGSWRLLRRLGYGRTEASFGALTVALGGVALSVSAMQDKLFALAWAPWALAGLLAAVDGDGSRRDRIGGGLATIAALALAILGGGLDVVVMTVLVGVPLAALDGGRSRPLARTVVRRGALAAGCVVGGGLVAAVQWLPFADWLGTTDWSAGAAPAELLSRSLRPHHLLGLISPNAGYVPALDSLRFPWRPPDPILFYQPGSYMGGAGLWLAAIGAMVGLRRSGPARVAAVGATICLVLALGPALPPIGWAETELPLLSMIRYPHKWAMPAVLLGSVLVAEGVRALRASPERSRLAVVVVAAAMAASGLLALAALVAPTASDAAAPVSWRQLFGGAAAASGIAAVVCLLLVGSSRVRGGAFRHALPGLALALCAADLALFNLPLAPVEEPATAWAPSETAAALAAETSPVRVFPFSYTAAGVYPDSRPGASLTQVLRESLFPGIPAGHGFALPFGWLVMHPAHLRDTYTGLGSLPMTERLRRLRLAGVTHLLVHREEHLAPLLAIPTVALVDTVRGAACSVSILRLDAPLPDVRWTPRDDPAASGQPVRTVSDSGGRFEARVEGSAAGRLVWLRPWDPYWVATVDGAQVATERVNGHQLSIPVDPGEHVVALAYRVPSLAAGGAISLLSSLGLLAGAMTLLRRRSPAP